MLLGIVLGAVLSAETFAGGADVSDDEIYSDGVALTTYDGSPLDIDGDGNTDLAIAANRGTAAEASRYYLGNGDGTFSAAVVLDAGASSRMVAADLNGDMFLDLVQGRRDLTDLLYVNDGAGGLDASADISADTTRTLGMAIGDLDNDGDLDIVTGNGRASGGGAHQPNRFYLNDLIPGGTVAFTGEDIAADADNTRSIALADLDGDGDLDVVVGSDETTPNSNRVYLNQVTGTGTVDFDAGIDFDPADDLTTEVLIGDLNDDGQPDIVVLNADVGASSGINRFYINETNAGVFALDAGTDISADTDLTNGGVLADFDGDGDLDLAVANFIAEDASQSSRNRLYLNQFEETGTVSFSAGIDITDDEQMSHELDAADLNGDGHLDIVVGNRDDVAGVRDRIYLNNGTADPFTNPSFTSTPVTDATEDVAYTYDITTTDSDVGDPVDITAADPLPAWLTLTDNGDGTATLTGTPEAGDVGDHAVSLQVSDGTFTSMQDFTIAVSAASPANNPPEFTSTAVTAATEGEVYTYDITATDADGDPVQITAPTLPGWLTLTDNGDGTATLTGTPANSDVGDHPVSLQASDGTDTAAQDFTITVAAAGGGANNAPAFESTPVTDATEGEDYAYDIEATDADGDPLEITASTLPGWLTLTDNGDGTATLEGTPADTDVGDHDVVLEVSDGTDAASQAFTVTVEAAATEPPQEFPPPRISGGGSLNLLSLITLLAGGLAISRRRRKELAGSR